MSLTKSEETVLLAVWKLNDNAYGVKIKKQIQEMTGREYLYNTLYTTLEQLVRKGFLRKYYGAPTPIRGGKRKIYFNLTDISREALKDAFLQQKSLWQGITDTSFDAG